MIQSEAKKFNFSENKKEPEVPPSSAPAPPPLPPPSTSVPTTPAQTLKRTTSTKSIAEDNLQDELNMVLKVYREKRKDLEIKQTPEIYINQRSTPQEVQHWLKVKEFQPNVCQRLKLYSGNEIMSLSRQQAEVIAGPDEGKRLYSQISLQKNVCGVSIHLKL